MDAVYDKEGRQIPDPTPVELPLGYTHPSSLQDQIAMMIRVSEDMAKANDMDTEEEANDFDVEDEEFAGDSRHVYTELQEEQLKDLEKAFKGRASRVPATDEADHDDEGEPEVTGKGQEHESPAPPRKPGYRPRKKKAPEPDAVEQ